MHGRGTDKILQVICSAALLDRIAGGNNINEHQYQIANKQGLLRKAYYKSTFFGCDEILKYVLLWHIGLFLLLRQSLDLLLMDLRTGKSTYCKGPVLF